MATRKLINEASICTLARSYNILDYYQNLKTVLSHAYSHSLNNCPKQDLHWLINELLLDNYTGESTLKAKLTDLFIQQDVIAAFEIKVNNSRVDFLTINGESKSFEIKSQLDNLYKLSKQVNDFEQVFDKNYIVVDEKHFAKAKTLIPNHYGIIILQGRQLINIKNAELNINLNPRMQLSLFSKKEMDQAFKIPGVTLEEILVNFEAQEINDIFKTVLKKRYAKRWQFLVENSNQIYSTDYQFFFKHNIQPGIIYK